MLAFLKSDLFVKFIAGFAIGVVGVFTLHPADTTASSASASSGATSQSWTASASL